MNTNDESLKPITIEGARLIFRNFEGREERFNAKGRRNFCVLLDEDIANELSNDGWNVKYLSPREEGDAPQAYIQVKVTFGKRPPKVVVITGSKKKLFDESDISKLDWMTFEHVDVKIRPYEYDINGKTGVSAYLKTMYATLMEDELDAKYASIEEDDDLPFEE